jgi:hypothetical protein
MPLAEPAGIYRPRHPERSVVYRLFEEHFERYAREVAWIRGRASTRVVLRGWQAVIGLGTTPGRPPSWVAAMDLIIHPPPSASSPARRATPTALRSKASRALFLFLDHTGSGWSSGEGQGGLRGQDDAGTSRRKHAP